MADGEGFEPPVELPPQRFSRPPHSTALPTILNFISRRSFNLRFCSLTAPDGAAHHSLAFGRTAFALLTRMQDRRNAPSANHPKLSFPSVFQPVVWVKQRRLLYIIFCELQIQKFPTHIKTL